MQHVQNTGFDWLADEEVEPFSIFFIAVVKRLLVIIVTIVNIIMHELQNSSAWSFSLYRINDRKSCLGSFLDTMKPDISL